MKASETAKDVHATIRREVVDALVPSFTPHGSGNLLDGFLRDFDKNGLVLLELAFRAHANEALDRVVELLLTHRVAWYSSAPHHRVILETEPDAAMKTMADAVLALKE